MQEISPRGQVEREEASLFQRELLPVEYADLQVIRSGEKVGVFCSSALGKINPGVLAKNDPPLM